MTVAELRILIARYRPEAVVHIAHDDGSFSTPRPCDNSPDIGIEDTDGEYFHPVIQLDEMK